MGSSFNGVLCQMLSLTPGKYLERYVPVDSIQMIKRAENASDELTKKRRRHLKFKKIAKQKDKATEEGESYVPGQFDY